MARRTPTTERRAAPGRHRPTGFTLIESLLACTVLALGVVSVGGVLAASHQHDRFVLAELAAAELSRAGVEEASSAPFSAAAGPVVADYDGLTVQVDAEGRDVASPYPGAELYARRIDVSFPDALLGARGEGNLAIVTATVVAPNGRSITLRRLVVRDTLSGE